MNRLTNPTLEQAALKIGSLLFILAFILPGSLLAKNSRRVPADFLLVPVASAPTQLTQAMPPIAKIVKPLKEREKIQYLIKQVELSPYTFVRNGKTHSGREAASHIRMKYQYGFKQIHSADEFIEGIASRSMATGQDYLIETKDGVMYSVRDVLHNELSHLEHQAQDSTSPSTGGAV